MSKRPKVVVMGGGSGTAVVLAGLKKYDLDLTAIISVADSGGSTGRLRDEFGFQPVGDLRQSLAAMATNGGNEWIKKLLLYRFDHGTFDGHNVGNLILTSLQDLTGSTAGALEIATHIFKISGQIMPVTEQNVQLVVEYDNGEFKIGEHILDESKEPRRIKRVLLSPRASLYKKARHAIEDADLIIIGPGDYFASLQATLAVSGLKPAFARTRAKVVYVVNLMTRQSQTQGMTATDHVTGIEKRLGRPLTKIVMNNGPIAPAILKHYAADKEYPVEDDLGTDKRVMRAKIASSIPYHTDSADRVPRSLLRHDQAASASLLTSFLDRSHK